MFIEYDFDVRENGVIELYLGQYLTLEILDWSLTFV